MTTPARRLSRDLGRKWDEWDHIGRAAVLKRNTPIHVIDGADLAAWKKATEPISRQVDRRTQQGRRQRRRAGQGGASPGREVFQLNDPGRTWQRPAPSAAWSRRSRARARSARPSPCWAACLLVRHHAGLERVRDRTRPVAAALAPGSRAFPAISRSCSSAARWPCSPSFRCASSSAPTCWSGPSPRTCRCATGPCSTLPPTCCILMLSFAARRAARARHGGEVRNHDTTMVLRIPEGWAYAVALAFAWLLVMVTAYTVARSVMKSARTAPSVRGHPGSNKPHVEFRRAGS